MTKVLFDPVESLERIAGLRCGVWALAPAGGLNEAGAVALLVGPVKAMRAHCIVVITEVGGEPVSSSAARLVADQKKVTRPMDR